MADRLVFIGANDKEFEQYFNIPERNTRLLLLGSGTSITEAAARRLADSNVVFGFCGSGGSPLHSTIDAVFVQPQSEYGPTEYMQAWMRLWLDEAARLAAAKELLVFRSGITRSAWGKNPLTKSLIDDNLVNSFTDEIWSASDTSKLLSLEAHVAKVFYAKLSSRFLTDKFSRKQGEGKSSGAIEVVNAMLDHGNYLAYGFAAVALNTLGISYALPLLHGKTRRGALVFDLADLIKDAIVMPCAFEYGSKNAPQIAFRSALIERLHDSDALDIIFTFVKNMCEKIVDFQ